MKRVNLQLFADGAKTEPKEKPEIVETPPAKKDTSENEDIGKKLDKLMDMLKPKEVEQKEAVQVPTPKPAIPANPEKEIEKPKEETAWQKFWKAIW